MNSLFTSSVRGYPYTSSSQLRARSTGPPTLRSTLNRLRRYLYERLGGGRRRGYQRQHS
jgi:hypothetical protein